MTQPDATHPIARLLTQGGDARIAIDPATGLNRYFASPYPRDIIAYASSTANDISAGAFDQLTREPPIDDYAAALDEARGRIRAAYALPTGTDIVFAASGTDLEYVALAVAGAGPITNILLGADEVGSGCIHSANGCYFAEATPLGVPTAAGAPVPGLGERVAMADVPVRDGSGKAMLSESIIAAMDRIIGEARRTGRQSLIHAVHGSKTGLVLPHLNDLDQLIAQHRGHCRLVIDACQARITSRSLADYLARGAVVFLTGSKFMGGPPFSGFAVLPPGLADGLAPLPEGLATIFRRAEWPDQVAGRTALPDSTNPGLVARLRAAMFELIRFQALPHATVERVILTFHAAVRTAIIGPLGVRRIAPYPTGDAAEADHLPIEMRTLSTLDISAIARTFDDAQALQKRLALAGVRLGQPVKCVALPEGGWGGTLRIGISMPQITALAAMAEPDCAAALDHDMRAIADAIREAVGGS